jgi:hypothetical protein
MKQFGKHLNLRKKSSPLDEKELFCEIIEVLETTIKRSNKLYKEHGLEFKEYDENFLLVIDNLFFLKYGEWKTTIIVWYLWERMDEEGNIGELEYEDLDTGKTKVVRVKCAEDLWDIIKEIENNTN